MSDDNDIFKGVGNFDEEEEQTDDEEQPEREEQKDSEKESHNSEKTNGKDRKPVENVSPGENRAQIASDIRDAIIEGDASSVSSDEVASPEIVLKSLATDGRDARDAIISTLTPPTPISTITSKGNFTCRYCGFKTDIREYYEGHTVMKHPRKPGY